MSDISPWTPPQNPLSRFTIGDYKITVFYLGHLSLDGGAMFGVVPKTMWEKLTPPDAKNRIPLAMNCLLVEVGDEKIFLDAGVGTKFSQKYVDIYGIRQEAGDIYETPVDLALASVGLKSGDITKAIFTHLHFDHAGGATRQLVDGTIIPTFENARYIVHKGEWDYAEHPHERCKASYLKENFMPLKEAGQLEFMDGDRTEIAPGLYQQITGGHTPYHQILTLDTPDGGFVYWGDLIPTRHHLRIPFVMGYDEYPVETMAAKRKLLHEVVDKGWIHIFEHDPEVPACRLKPTEKPDVYDVEPLENLVHL